MSALADTHCHLYFELFNNDLEQVLERAAGAGVDRILVPGIDIATSQEAVRLAERYPQIFAAVGVHPNEAKSWDAQALDILGGLCAHPKVVAVGEIGLDYYRDYAPQALQRQVFWRQLELAAGQDLPVVIHNRQAAQDVLQILSDWRGRLLQAGLALAGRPGVLHSFSEDAAVAQQATAISFEIGITGPVTFRNAPDLRQTVSQLPAEHILIETDAPYLTPHPYRGERNEPAYVRYVAEKIAEIRGLPPETVATQTSSNAARLFRWRETV